MENERIIKLIFYAKQKAKILKRIDYEALV